MGGRLACCLALAALLLLLPAPRPALAASSSPSSSRPSSSRPSSARPTSSVPSSSRPSSSRPSSLGPTSARPTSAQPTSARPTSARPTSARPTSARPTSARPTSARPTSARPTSARPTSVRPSARPSALPTFRPTSARPTVRPSGQPTSRPSLRPSSQAPSLFPTSHSPSSHQPSSLPTAQPNSLPTTSSPATATPTMLPTVLPTARPTTTTSAPVSPTPNSVAVSIEVTSYPPYNESYSNRFLVGTVQGAPSGSVIAAYVYTDAWWNKGSAVLSSSTSAPFSFNVDLNTVYDPLALVLGLVVLPVGVTTPPTCDDTTHVCAALPAGLAQWQVARGPLAVNFSSRAWVVKNYPHERVGPGNNFFAPENVAVDAKGRLALTASFDNITGLFASSEVQLVDSLGYGTYVFYLDGGNTDKLDPALTLGLFSWDDFASAPYREIDFEIGRWNNAADPTDAQFVVQPYSQTGHLKRITIPAGDVTLVMRWTPGNIGFAVFQGQACIDAASLNATLGSPAVTNWTFTGSGVPTPGSEKMHINLWLNAQPSVNKSTTIHVHSFDFVAANDSQDVEICPPVSAYQTGSLVPLYIYPPWPDVIAAVQQSPNVPVIAVINPASGPGDAVNSDYVSGIQGLRNAGVVVLGYVHTTYGQRSWGDCVQEMQDYSKWYDVQGIFLDEMASEVGFETYYRNLTQAARALGLSLIAGNPGVEPAASYFDVGVDIVVVFENFVLPDNSVVALQTTFKGLAQRAVIPYNVSSWTQSWLDDAMQRAGWIYVQSADLPNPWGTLPVWFADLLSAMA